MLRKAVDWDIVEKVMLKRISKVKLIKDESKRLRNVSQA
jgi:hypothetical protein